MATELVRIFSVSRWLRSTRMRDRWLNWAVRSVGMVMVQSLEVIEYYEQQKYLGSSWFHVPKIIVFLEST
jgi:hypothetical protein